MADRYPRFVGPLPADHPLRAERDEPPANLHCDICHYAWTAPVFDGEVEEPHRFCERCGGDGRRRRFTSPGVGR